jgi:hypothetical protein
MTFKEKIKEKVMKLQTYKMFVGEDTVYVERDDVLKLLEQEFREEPSSSEKPNKSEIPTGSTTNNLALIHTEGLDEEIRCTMCTNYMKSDRGCDGSCVVNKDMYKAVMDAIEKRILPTPKNDLGVDCISRQDVLSEIIRFSTEEGSSVECQQLYCDVNNMPSVTPQEPRWIPVSERYPKIEDEYKYFLVTDSKGKVSVQEFFISLDEDPQPYFSGMVDVIAWMPLPTPYKPQESEKT